VAVFLEISNKDLKPFFDVWFRSFKLPQAKITHSVHREEKEFMLKFHISQKGDTFVFPLWVEWIENKKIVRKMMVVDKKEHTFQFSLAHKPKRIQINPDNAVPGEFH
jgi:aminopeptidase N